MLSSNCSSAARAAGTESGSRGKLRRKLSATWIRYRRPPSGGSYVRRRSRRRQERRNRRRSDIPPLRSASPASTKLAIWRPVCGRLDELWPELPELPLLEELLELESGDELPPEPVTVTLAFI